MSKYIIYGLYIVLAVVIFFTIYNIIKQIQMKKVVDNIMESSEEKTLKRTLYYEQLHEEYGVIDKIKFKRKIDILLIRSGLKDKFKFLNADIFIIISILFSSIVSVIAMLFLKRLAISIGVGVIAFLVLQLIIYILTNINYEKVDNQIIIFLNLLENFSSTNDDIVSIFQQASEYLTYPLNKYCNEFVAESKSTGNTRLAFTNLADKIENEKLRDVITNLEISSRNDANYSEIISKSKDVIQGYFSSKENKKSIKRDGQFNICLSVAMGLVIIVLMQDLIPNLWNDLTNTAMGNWIIIYWIATIVACFYNFIALQKN